MCYQTRAGPKYVQLPRETTLRKFLPKSFHQNFRESLFPWFTLLAIVYDIVKRKKSKTMERWAETRNIISILFFTASGEKGRHISICIKIVPLMSRKSFYNWHFFSMFFFFWNTQRKATQWSLFLISQTHQQEIIVESRPEIILGESYVPRVDGRNWYAWKLSSRAI